jgi:hypothetical protein
MSQLWDIPQPVRTLAEDIVWIRYQETASEDIEDFMCAGDTAIFWVCKPVRLLQLHVVTICKWSINRATNPNPFCSNPDTWQIYMYVCVFVCMHGYWIVNGVGCKRLRLLWRVIPAFAWTKEQKNIIFRFSNWYLHGTRSRYHPTMSHTWSLTWS